MASKKHADRGRKVASPPDTPEIAASLAAAGWPVFPVTIYQDDAGKRHKVPAVKWKDEATTDVGVVQRWWAGEHSGRWIGVYAGKAGIVVLDVDPGGDENLEAAGLTPPETFSYPTHRAGGRHHVYRAPEGIDLTIAKNLVVEGHTLAGIDVRSGSGFMVYYGPKLKKRPKLAPAPSWLLVEKGSRNGAGQGSNDLRDPSATESAFRARLYDSKPKKDLAKTIRAQDFPAGAAHEPMLETVAALVSEGVKGTPGVLRLLDETRERYIEGGPDRARDWDNAIAGSVQRFGLPPVTIEMSKAERREVARQQSAEAVEARAAERKAAFRVEKHHEALTRPEPGNRVLEDGPLADELAPILGREWTYSTGLGLMRWTGQRWKPAEEHSLIEAVKRLLTDIEVDEHTAAAMRGDNKAIDKARTILSRSRAAAVARLVVGILAESDPVFDDHPDLLNTPSGVVDLRTAELLPHDPGLYLTKITAAPYDPDADMTLWKKALTAVPVEVAEWLQVRFGQMATGYPPDDDALVIFEGAGENGKTTVLHGPRKALGDYATTLPERLLMANPNDHPTTLMNLFGARMGVIEELPEGRNLNVKRLKDTVGTPEITARRMRQDDITFPATHGLMLSTNYLPIVVETDHGTWRRLLLVRFRLRYVKSAKRLKSKRDRVGDRRLKAAFAEKISEHHAGMLRWIVEGARRWYDAGMVMPEPPARVERDTERWRMDADPILAYVGERIVRDEGYAITAMDLATDFNLWMERRGHKAWSQQTINSRFQGHISMDGVSRKMVKFGATTASRPRSIIEQAPPKTTTSWKGIRFADDPTYIPSEAQADAAAFDDLARRASR